MIFKERWYQKEASDKIMEFLDAKEGNPLAVLPTGSGKTVIICGLIDRWLSKFPDTSVLVLSHVKEILSQDHSALSSYFQGHEIGLWSSGLGVKNKKKITVAGIQSIKNNTKQFSKVSLIIIDEAHLINHKNHGSYRKFFEKMDARLVGLTATPYRLGQGYLTDGDSPLFTEIVYDLSSFKNFNRLIEEGYLSDLITVKSKTQLKTDGLKVIAGDFSESEMSKKFNRISITNSAIKEILNKGKDRKRWLVFAIDIAHAEAINTALVAQGVSSAVIHSKMKEDRQEAIEKLRSGTIRCLVNVNCLTTGIDIPTIDLIAAIRPTKSHVLHVQAIGRGLRCVYAPDMPLDTPEQRRKAMLASEKANCLVLDFAGNTERLGAINDIQISDKKRSVASKSFGKVCPVCSVINHPTIRICVCGHEFEFQEKIISNPFSGEIIKKESDLYFLKVVKSEYDIKRVNGSFAIFAKYYSNSRVVKETIILRFNYYKSFHWIRERLPRDILVPKTVSEVNDSKKFFRKVNGLKMNGGKIVEYVFEDSPSLAG